MKLLSPIIAVMIFVVSFAGHLDAENGAEGAVEMAEAIEPPPNINASPNIRCLYQLSLIGRCYLLDIAYQTAVGSSTLDDAYWALRRATQVSELLDSPFYQQISPSLRRFCLGGLLLDAMFQKTASMNERATSQTKRDARDLIYRRVRGLMDANESDNGDGDLLLNATEAALKISARANDVRNAFNQFVNTKQQGDYHRKWAQLLLDMSSSEPELAAFARVPQLTDPTWHFMRSREAGDVFFGQSIATRARENQAPAFDSPIKVNVDGLTEGPVRLNFSSVGKGFVYDVICKVPKGTRLVFSGECQRGHFGLTVGDESTWLARGMVEPRYMGKVDTSKIPYFFSGDKIFVFHLPITGISEDEEAKGSVLIYISGQFSGDVEAAKLARTIKL